MPTWSWPARSTVCNILSRHELVPKKRRRRPLGHPGRPTTPMTEPNEIWTADFKGEFRTLDGVYGYPLTVADGFSRYLLACHGLLSTAHDGASPQQNGRHERMHRTLKAETTRPAARTRLAQQRRFSRFREEFNYIRPHEAIGQKTPSSL